MVRNLNMAVKNRPHRSHSFMYELSLLFYIFAEAETMRKNIHHLSLISIKQWGIRWTKIRVRQERSCKGVMQCPRLFLILSKISSAICVKYDVNTTEIYKETQLHRPKLKLKKFPMKKNSFLFDPTIDGWLFGAARLSLTQRKNNSPSLQLHYLPHLNYLNIQIK